MSSWGTVWHLAKWELVRMRWWVTGVTALMMVQVFFALAEWWDNPTFSFGVVASVAPLLLAVLVAFGDSPLPSTSFYRGRPIPWWGIPAAKLLMLLLALAGPALLLSVAPLLQWPEPWDVRVGHLRDIVTACAVIAVTGLNAGAITGSLTQLAVIAVARVVVAQLTDLALKPTAWEGAPWLVWTCSLLLVALGVAVYRRRWHRRHLVGAIIALSLLSSIGSTKGHPDRVNTWSPLPDSVQVTVDSVSQERPHVVRVAFSVETTAPIDGVRLSEHFVNLGTPSALFGLGRLGHASDVRVRGASVGSHLISMSDPDGHREVSLKDGNDNGGSGRSSGDLFFDAPDTRGVRRARAVAIVAVWDTILPLAYTASVVGRVTGLRANSEGLMVLDTTAAPGTGLSRWRLRRRQTDDGARWMLERRALGTIVADTLNAPLSSAGRYATRFIEHGRRTSTGLLATGARSTFNIPIVTGLTRSVETVAVAGWTQSPSRPDTVEILRLEPLKRFDMYTSVTLARESGRTP